MRYGEARAIVEAAIALGRKLTVNYWPNFEAQALELRRLYQAGVLGALVHVESYLGYNLSEFGLAIKQDSNHWVRRMPGKLFQNVLDHIVNKIMPFLEDDRPFIHAAAWCGEPAGAVLHYADVGRVVGGLSSPVAGPTAGYSHALQSRIDMGGTSSTMLNCTRSGGVRLFRHRRRCGGLSTTSTAKVRRHSLR